MPDEVEAAIKDLETIAAEVAPVIDVIGGIPKDAKTWQNVEWGNVGSDGGITFVKDSDVEVSDNDLRSAFASSPELRVLEPWIQSIASSNRRARRGGLFERDKYAGAKGVFEQFKVAREAAENDDIVSNILETTEALVLNKVRIECADDDEEDIWNQISKNMNLDARFREMWRELFTYSQYYVTMMWDEKTFKIDGQGPQRARRKTYTLKVPSAVSLLDPMKVIPVGDFLFGKDKLVYVANRAESTSIDDVIAGANTSDQVVRNLLTGKYSPSQEERNKISEIIGTGVDLSHLYVLNPQLVWRHTATHPSYARFAPVRMKSVFELLDLKHQLREMDRTRLLGSTNFIILVRKGSKEKPATPGELASLNVSVRTVAQTPLIVGDHRLSIDMITPDMDATLDPARYNTIDSRIAARLYQIFHLGNFSAGTGKDDSLKLIRVVARGLESRRQMIKENLERNLLHPIFEQNKSLKCRPSIQFTPRSIALDFDANFLQIMMDLYFDGSISRDTILGVVDLRQEDEFFRREIEAEKYDKVMTPRDTPPGRKAGLLGGNNNGGGLNPNSVKPNPAPRRNENDIPIKPKQQ